MAGWRSLAALMAIAGSLASGPAAAESVADFYKGKAVRVLVGSGVELFGNINRAATERRGSATEVRAWTP
jgi:hypothetical protein